MAERDPLLAKQFRAVAIQAFGCSFEISIRMLRRRLKENMSTAEVECLSYLDLLCVGEEKGFIDEPVVWFREMRDMTSAQLRQVVGRTDRFCSAGIRDESPIPACGTEPGCYARL